MLRECVENYIYDELSNEWVKALSTPEGHSLVEIAPVERTPLSFEDINFVTGSSPVILDVNAAYSENGREFTVINDGAGEFTVSISNDGTAWGDEHTVKNGEAYTFENISIDSIRITWVSNSAYRAVVL